MVAMNLALSHSYYKGLECHHPVTDEVICVRGVAKNHRAQMGIVWLSMGIFYDLIRG